MIRKLDSESPFPAGQRKKWDHILTAPSYPDFRKALERSNCRLCPLHSERNRIVVDRGNHSAKILLVGEGPGAHEDQKGKAFVGASGKLLDRILRDSGLDPEADILIANVVKCRPPGNRAPVKEEVNRCFPFLFRQIELVRPKYIVLLGATAVRHVLRHNKRQSMKELAGRYFSRGDCPDCEILVTYHPAYVLRYRKKMEDMVKHLSVLATCLQ